MDQGGTIADSILGGAGKLQEIVCEGEIASPAMFPYFLSIVFPDDRPICLF